MAKVSKSAVLATAMPSFDDAATRIVAAFEAFDDATASLTGAVEVVMQQYVDKASLTVATRDRAACDALGKAIRDCQVVTDVCDGMGAMSRKTFTEYAQSAMRAFHYNVPWSAGLKNNPEYALPWGKGKATKPTKAGTVTTTTDAEAFKTARKLIAQWRTLKRDLAVGLLIDACCEIDPDFTE